MTQPHGPVAPSVSDWPGDGEVRRPPRRDRVGSPNDKNPSARLHALTCRTLRASWLYRRARRSSTLGHFGALRASKTARRREGSGTTRTDVWLSAHSRHTCISQNAAREPGPAPHGLRTPSRTDVCTSGISRLYTYPLGYQIETTPRHPLERSYPALALHWGSRLSSSLPPHGLLVTVTVFGTSSTQVCPG